MPLALRRFAPAVLAVTVILALAAATLMASSQTPARAQVPGAPGSVEEISDQQDVALDSGGSANVDFRKGDFWDECLSGGPIVTVQLAATLTSGKPQPVTSRQRLNSACGFRITVLDGAGRPITNARVRIGYIAIVKGAADYDAPAPGVAQKS
jgi:hypothetical protein